MNKLQPLHDAISLTAWSRTTLQPTHEERLCTTLPEPKPAAVRPKSLAARALRALTVVLASQTR